MPYHGSIDIVQIIICILITLVHFIGHSQLNNIIAPARGLQEQQVRSGCNCFSWGVYLLRHLTFKDHQLPFVSIRRPGDLLASYRP